MLKRTGRHKAFAIWPSHGLIYIILHKFDVFRVLRRDFRLRFQKYLHVHFISDRGDLWLVAI